MILNGVWWYRYVGIVIRLLLQKIDLTKSPASSYEDRLSACEDEEEPENQWKNNESKNLLYSWLINKSCVVRNSMLIISHGLKYTFHLSIQNIHLSIQNMLSCVQLFVTLWAVACQAPLSMGFPRQEYWSRVPLPTPGNSLIQGLNPPLLCVMHCRRIIYWLIFDCNFRKRLCSWKIYSQAF